MHTPAHTTENMKTGPSTRSSERSLAYGLTTKKNLKDGLVDSAKCILLLGLAAKRKT